MKVAIWDMDSTIVDSNHRYRTLDDGSTIDLQYWRDNCTPDKIACDTLLPLAAKYKADIKDALCFVVIATARVLEQADMQYIADKLGMPDYIISRKPNDSRPDYMLKVAGLRKLFGLRQFDKSKAVFYDDNMHNIQHVSAMGIESVHVS